MHTSQTLNWQVISGKLQGYVSSLLAARSSLLTHSLCAMALVLFVSGHTLAQLPDLIPLGLNAGDKYYLVFNSTVQTDATSSDINHYNSLVLAAADAADIGTNKGVTWSAIVSTPGVDARDNAVIAAEIPVYNMSMQLVATGFDDMWDATLTNSLAFDENGDSNFVDTWTGTLTDGTAATGFSLGEADNAWCGRPAFTDSQWTNYLTPITGLQLGVFALSSPLTVPEPSSLLLAAVGLGIGLTRRPRRHN